MGVLDELRQQAEELHLEEQAGSAREAAETAARKDSLHPRMELIYAYLNEFVSHLNYVRPEIVVTGFAGGSRGLDALVQGNYVLGTGQAGAVNDNADLSRITLRFSCYADGEHEYELRGKQAIEREMRTLSEARVSYDYKPIASSTEREQVAALVIKRNVPVIFEFEADTQAEAINLSIRNLDGFGLKQHALRPEQINEPFLEELGKAILRRENSFLREELSEDERLRLRERLLRDKQNRGRKLTRDESDELREIDRRRRSEGRRTIASRVRRLFGR